MFSKTAGYRHASIPAGIAAIESLGVWNGFEIDATEDDHAFSDENLDRYAVVVFLSTTGDILDRDQERAFERFIRKGRGFVGVHSATDTEYDWFWYGLLAGAYFSDHPAIQSANIHRLDSLHLSTRELPALWARTDEWYNFRTQPPPEATVLLNLDESSYTGGTMGASHPVSWFQEYDGGRSWYTALGHTTESFSEPEFLRHLGGGILWAAGIARDSVIVGE
ncbi:MAG TPA: ThuA domain-containing protein [Bacteroidota bacterium]